MCRKPCGAILSRASERSSVGSRCTSVFILLSSLHPTPMQVVPYNLPVPHPTPIHQALRPTPHIVGASEPYALLHTTLSALDFSSRKSPHPTPLISHPTVDPRTLNLNPEPEPKPRILCVGNRSLRARLRMSSGAKRRSLASARTCCTSRFTLALSMRASSPSLAARHAEDGGVGRG